MELRKRPVTDIYIRNEADHLITLVFLNKQDLSEILVLTRFSFYLVNVKAAINLEGFTPLFPKEGMVEFVEGLTATDIHDIVYVKLGNDQLVVLTNTFDNYSGDSYQHLRVIAKKDSPVMTPLSITEYEKFNKDFESGIPCDVLDLRFS